MHADTLVASQGSTFADKLSRLEMLRTVKADASTAYLAEVQNIALGSPGDLYLMLMWMEQHHLALFASEWIRSLPPEQINVPPVCVAVASVFSRSAEWERLRDFLDDRNWAEWDYLRRAFLSRMLEKLGDEDTRAAQEWADAIAAARSQPDAIPRLERLVRLAIGWGWEQRAQDTMWGMVNAPLCPPWIPDALRQIAEENADAGQLQKLAALRLRADPKSAVLRNAFAFYSLLARSDSGDPHREAERLFAEHPGDESVLLTRALSLYVQGEPAGAAALTGSLPSEALKRPRTALYHAIFLTAAGESAKASEFVTVAQDWKMLPEEKTLLDRAKTIASKAAGEQEIAASAKALRAAKAARDLEAEKAVVAARAERMAKAAQAAQDAQDAAQSPAPAKSGGLVPPR